MGGARAKSTSEGLRRALDALLPERIESFDQELKLHAPLPREAPQVVAEWALAAGLEWPVEFDRVGAQLAQRGDAYLVALGEAAADYGRSERRTEASYSVLRHLLERLAALGQGRAAAVLAGPALQKARNREEADQLLAWLRQHRPAILEHGGGDAYREALSVYLEQHATRLDQTVELVEEAMEIGCSPDQISALVRLGSELPGSVTSRQLAAARLPELAPALAEPLPPQVEQILDRLLKDRVWPAALRCGAHLLRAGTSAQPDALRINLAICLLWLGDGEIALTVLTTPGSGDMEVQRLYHRGLCYESLGGYNAASQSYDETLALDPGHALAWRRRARAMREAGRFDEARQDADCLETFDPVGSRIALAMIHLRSEAWHEAERGLTGLAGELTGAQGKRALFYRAVSRHLQGKLALAAQDYERLAEDFEGAYNLGHVLAQSRDFEGAERWYSACLRLEPRSLPALANRALVRLEAGMAIAAEQDVARVRRFAGSLPVDWARWLEGHARRPSPFAPLVEPRGLPITLRW